MYAYSRHSFMFTCRTHEPWYCDHCGWRSVVASTDEKENRTCCQLDQWQITTLYNTPLQPFLSSTLFPSASLFTSPSLPLASPFWNSWNETNHVHLWIPASCRSIYNQLSFNDWIYGDHEYLTRILYISNFLYSTFKWSNIEMRMDLTISACTRSWSAKGMA